MPNIKRTYLDVAKPAEEFEYILNKVMEMDITEDMTLKGFEKERLAWNLARGMKDFDTIVARDIETDRIVGFMVFTQDCPWWKDEKCLFNLVWNIERGYRSYKLTRDFLAAGEKYAKMLGYTFFPSFSFVEDVGRKLKLMTRLGYVPEIVCFKKV